MAKYKLIRLHDVDGEINYEINNIDEWDYTLVSWDYKKLKEIASKLNVGEEYIIEI